MSDHETKSSVLIVYFTFTQQTGLVAEAMADRFSSLGFDVTKALLEFTDPKYSKVVSKFPVRFPFLRILPMLVPQRRRKTGEIKIPEAAQSGDYDLVVIGSPTWWLTVDMPIRSYLESSSAKNVLNGKPFGAYAVCRRYWKQNMREVRKMGEQKGGTWAGETHFVALGNQVTSLWSWLAYMKHGAPKRRSMGVKLPPPNLTNDFQDQARRFVDDLVGGTADR